MKTPRDVPSDRLAALLASLGYGISRQKGSHLRMLHPGPPRHAVTVPMHRTVKTGTLHAILSEVARMRSLEVEDLIRIL